MKNMEGTRFEARCRLIDVDSIVTLKPKWTGRKKAKYQLIVASIRSVGLVEAPVVLPIASTPETFCLLDGHLRIQALKELGIRQVSCLIATADDSYTYNRQVSRLSAVQDHRMITAAIERGVPAERLAEALGVSMQVLTRRKNLLDGICPEAQRMLADKECPGELFLMLRRLKPLRQIEACEFMESQGNHSLAFMRAILGATPPDQMVTPRRKPMEPGSAEAMMRMEKELAELQDRIQMVESTYGPDVLRLTVIKTYLAELLARSSIRRFLRANHPELLKEFEKIAKETSVPEVATA